MNKQEAIEKIYTASWNDGYHEGLLVDVETVNKFINQIDEPQKVTIPKFVAEWLDECKRSGWHLQKALYSLDDDKVGDWAYDENDDLISEKVDEFARAWLDGYEVVQEKLYTVEIPSPNRTTEPIIYLSRDERGKIFLTSWFLLVGQNWKKHPHSQLTESEIKQDFEWAWDAGFAKEVE